MGIREYLTDSNFMLTEVKLSRVWQHINNPDAVVGIITAFRGENPYETNKRLNVELAQTLRANGYGYFFVDGFWVENEGKPDEKHVSEDSIFVNGEGEKDNIKMKTLLVQLSKKYNQDGFSFKEAGSKNFEIIDKNGKVDRTFKSVGYNKIALMYTKLRNRKETFVFESAHIPTGFIGRMSKG